MNHPLQDKWRQFDWQPQLSLSKRKLGFYIAEFSFYNYLISPALGSRSYYSKLKQHRAFSLFLKLNSTNQRMINTNTMLYFNSYTVLLSKRFYPLVSSLLYAYEATWRTSLFFIYWPDPDDRFGQRLDLDQISLVFCFTLVFHPLFLLQILIGLSLSFFYQSSRFRGKFFLRSP